MTHRSLLTAAAFVLVTVPVAPVEAQEVRKLTGVRFSYPTYTPSGEILYESAAGGDWNIFRIPAEGAVNGGAMIERLTESASLDRMPSMSPDGRYIAFISDRAGNYDVWRMDADGDNAVQLTTSEEHEIHPYWTPDSRAIVFNRQVLGEGLYAIWSMAADGSDEREVLRDTELNSYAQTSPDGRWLVFDKWWDNEESNGEIMLLELATGELARLTENDVYDGYPAWFPDSRHIVYSSEVGGVFKLFRLDIRTRQREQLTFGPGGDQRPAVSADGARVLFNRNLDGSIEIYELVLADGG
jgi:Tol biopolymer transport system component